MLERDWTGYYAATANEGPSANLLRALAFMGEGRGRRRAIDLGCGAGRDTFHLLAQGWEVIAIDAQREALDAIAARVDPQWRPRLRLDCTRFAYADLPRADLINAHLALSFCASGEFEHIWAASTAALVPGGVFCGNLFGPFDDWSGDARMTFQTLEATQGRLSGFEILLLRETRKDVTRFHGEVKHAHFVHFVARKPSA